MKVRRQSSDGDYALQKNRQRHAVTWLLIHTSMCMYVSSCTLTLTVVLWSCAVISFNNGLFFMVRIFFSGFLESHTLILHWPLLFKMILRFLRAFQHGCILYSCNLKINLLKLEKSLKVVSRNLFWQITRGIGSCFFSFPNSILESNRTAHLSSQSF